MRSTPPGTRRSASGAGAGIKASSSHRRSRYRIGAGRGGGNPMARVPRATPSIPLVAGSAWPRATAATNRKRNSTVRRISPSFGEPFAQRISTVP